MSEFGRGLLCGLIPGLSIAAVFYYFAIVAQNGWGRAIADWKKSNDEWIQHNKKSKELFDELHATTIKLHDTWLDWAYKNVPALELIQPRKKENRNN